MQLFNYVFHGMDFKTHYGGDLIFVFFFYLQEMTQK